MSFSKITDAMRAGKGNVGQPDTPGVTTSEMQEIMDELANLAIDSFNSHIDELSAETAAGYIGASVPDGITADSNVEAVMKGVAQIALDASSLKHSHANKSTIDAITETVKEEYDSAVQLLDGIELVQTAITNTDTAIPTSGAVASFVASYDIANKALSAVYPIGAVFSTTSNLNPSGLLNFGTWSEIGSADSYGVRRYVRTA